MLVEDTGAGHELCSRTLRQEDDLAKSSIPSHAVLLHWRIADLSCARSHRPLERVQVSETSGTPC